MKTRNSNLRIDTLGSLLALCLLPVAICAQGQTGQNSFAEYIRQTEFAAEFSGSVLVTRNDSILLAEGYGLASRETSAANTADTKFLLCSVTKPFTSLAVLQLVERGVIALDDPVTKFFSEYAGTSADRITIRHLLTHTSGIVDYLSLVDSSETFIQPVAEDRLISMFMAAPLEHEPGSQWQYSNSNYYLLGKIIEKVSGDTYGDYMKEHVFESLKMQNSGFPVSYLSDLPGSATGYRKSDDGSWAAVPAIHSSWPFSAGALYSSALDLAKWDKALRNESLLTAASKALMYSPFKWRYGCGWEIDTLYGLKVASHGGTGGGYCSILIRLIEHPLCVAILSNQETTFPQVSKLAYDLLAVALGRPPQDYAGTELAKIDPGLLEEYAGQYELAPGVALTFVCREGKLLTQGPGQPEVEIFPRSETEFFLKVVEGSVVFVRDSSGAVSGIVVQQGGRSIPARRVK